MYLCYIFNIDTINMKPIKKSGSLTFVKMTEPRITATGGIKPRAIFKCECGSTKDYDYYSIKARDDAKCIKCARKKAAKSRTRHGKMKHPLYRKWSDMKKRCYNPNVDRYKNYGGKGVKVCKEWKNDFKTFYNWCIDNGWKEELQIDRKDVEGDYTPDNCRFITHLEQGWNKRNTFFVEVNGKKIALAELMYKNNKSEKYKTVWHGLKTGKTIEYYINKYNLDTSFV